MSALAALLLPGTTWAFPASPCPVATPNCKTVVLSGVSSAPGNLLSAMAVFQWSGTTLTVTLSNVSADDTGVSSDLLTGLFFSLKDTSGNEVALTSGTAVLPAGSDVWNSGGVEAGQPTGDVVGQGFSSTGLDLFGNATVAGANLDGPTAVNGPQYGMLSAGHNPATQPLPGGDDYVKDSTRFTLTYAAGLSLSQAGAIASPSSTERP